MTTKEKKQVMNELEGAMSREFSAKEYYSLLANVSHREESSRVFEFLADEHSRTQRAISDKYGQIKNSALST
jgi:rubrerythrin